MDFALLQCAFPAPGRLPLPPRWARSPVRLSWSFVCPSADIPGAWVSPTTARGPPLRLPSANRTACSAFVVSLHRDGLLRTPAPGLLQPGTGHGVHCVSAFREPRTRTNPGHWLPRKASPQCGDTPRRIPLVCSRTASLRPLPSCGYRLFRVSVFPAPQAARRMTPSPARRAGDAATPAEAEASVVGHHEADSPFAATRQLRNLPSMARPRPGRSRSAPSPKDPHDPEPSKLGPHAALERPGRTPRRRSREASVEAAPKRLSRKCVTNPRNPACSEISLGYSTGVLPPGRRVPKPPAVPAVRAPRRSEGRVPTLPDRRSDRSEPSTDRPEIHCPNVIPHRAAHAEAPPTRGDDTEAPSPTHGRGRGETSSRSEMQAKS